MCATPLKGYCILECSSLNIRTSPKLRWSTIATATKIWWQNPLQKSFTSLHGGCRGCAWWWSNLDTGQVTAASKSQLVRSQAKRWCGSLELHAHMCLVIAPSCGFCRSISLHMVSQYPQTPLHLIECAHYFMAPINILLYLRWLMSLQYPQHHPPHSICMLLYSPLKTLLISGGSYFCEGETIPQSHTLNTTPHYCFLPYLVF